MRYLGQKLGSTIASDVKFFEHAFLTTRVDKEDFYKEVLPKSSRLQTTIEKYEGGYDKVYELSLDIFSALYRYLPVLVEENRMKYEYLINYKAIQQLMKDAKYKELRSMTRHDELTSLIGTELFLEQLMEIVSKIKEEFDEALDTYEKAKKEAEDAIEEAKKQGLLEDDPSLQEAKTKLEEARKELKELYDKKAKREVKKAINDLLNNTKAIGDTISNWGLGNDGTYSQMPYEEKVGMLDKLKNNDKLKKIALLAGKFTEIYLEGKKAQTKKTRSYIRDITMGDDLSRVLPSELISLKHPLRKRQFYKAYSEKRLLQHEYGGNVKKGKGPIVALIDCSTSMAGDSEIYAKATCMALLDVAKRQKRPFVAVHFDSGVAAKDLKANYFTRAHPYNIKEVVDMAEYFGGGGTEFEPPLERAKNEIDEDREFSKADIVMITDGCAPTGDSFLKEFLSWKKKKNVTLYAVLISSGYATTESLKEFSDKISEISDLENQGMAVARSIFTSLI